MTINISESQAPPDLISRDELAAIAQSEGMTLTTRTLRYWALMDWIPKPWRIEGEGQRAFYPLSLLERLRILSALRPRCLQKIKESLGEAETIQFGKDTFSVLPAIARWERENTEFAIQMLADGTGMLLIQRRKQR